MEWTLGIDTSSAELGLGLLLDGRPVCTLSRYRASSHAEHIADAVRAVVTDAGIGPSDVSRVGVAVGPGSFTGLRIGIAFVKGYFFGRAIRILPVSSLHAIAAAWPGSPQSLAVVLDARRSEVFWARFSCNGAPPRRLIPDTLSTAASLAESIPDGDVVAFDALGYTRTSVGDVLGKRGSFSRVEEAALQRGLACARIAAATPLDAPEWTTAVDLAPCYMRASAAEEKAAA